MTTIEETTGKLPDLIDGIASAATALSEWSDADPAVTNDGSSTNYVDNGRVLQHSSSGLYVGLFLQNSRYARHEDDYNNANAGGIRVVHSSDWDTENNVPAGNTDVRSADPWSGDVGNNASASFTTYNTDTGEYNWTHGNANGSTQVYVLETGDGIGTLQETDVTYFGSVTNNWINFGAWNTKDGQNGRCGYYTAEYIQDKFWADGNQPFAAYAQSSTSRGSETALASFQVYYGRANNNTSYPYSAAGFDRPEWCVVNPDSADDTYFFRRGVMYQTSSQSIPVAYIKAIIGNDINEGGAHGDTIDHSGETYRALRQSGAGTDKTISAALRYE
ncbi:hypothetical protein [Natrinema versiforme]|uniref:Uncharacterized protein n=1 Tax=Natrinema versiforme TaxID=88724 RepID=A0A4P8WIW8_9EURY|nr:hypothetical protein [Natrinema versiforme]QCS43417.1 hypothetical protein FEJ81_14045 [Natrinema versiforme]